MIKKVTYKKRITYPRKQASDTERYCCICKKKTRFHFDKNICHSYCSVCKNRNIKL